MDQTASNVGKEIEKWLICLPFCLKNWPVKSLKFILAFRPHSNWIARASNILARQVCAWTDLLVWKINWLVSRLVRTYIFSHSQFGSISHKYRFLHRIQNISMTCKGPGKQKYLSITSQQIYYGTDYHYILEAVIAFASEVIKNSVLFLEMSYFLSKFRL